LADLIAEVKQLVQDGVELAESHFEVTLHSFVCDSPARAMVKNVKAPTGYFGCDKCETQGNGTVKSPFWRLMLGGKRMLVLMKWSMKSIIWDRQLWGLCLWGWYHNSHWIICTLCAWKL